MAFTNFTEVQESINLINAALASSAWSKSNLDINTDSASSYRNAIAIKDLGDNIFEFYISSNKSGDWQWEKIADANSGLYKIVIDETERNNIPTAERIEGMPVYVLSTKSIHRLLNGITNTNWVVDIINETVPAYDNGNTGIITVLVGNVLSHYSMSIDYTLSNNIGTDVLIETGNIELTNKNDTIISVISNFDNVSINFYKQITNNEIYLILENNLTTVAKFNAKINWKYK